MQDAALGRAAGGVGSRWIKLVEFLTEYRETRLHPAHYLGKDTPERERFKPFRQARQHAHDDAASLRPSIRFACPGRLAGHRFRTGLPFATIVGRLDFRMHDEHEQL